MAEKGVTRGSSGNKKTKDGSGRTGSAGGDSKGGGDKGGGTKSGTTRRADSVTKSDLSHSRRS